jgi:hypothetical protein
VLTALCDALAASLRHTVAYDVVTTHANANSIA